MNIHFNGSSEIPSEKDFLGIENKRKGLLGFVQNCATPMTIAVQGNWGIGKTSLMKQLKNDIEPPEGDVNIKGVTVWFNTWQFSVLGEQDRLLIDLLILLCDKLFKLAKNNNDESIINRKNKVKKLMKCILKFGKASLAGAVNVVVNKIPGIESEDFENFEEGFEESYNKEENKDDAGNTEMISADDYSSYLADYQSYVLLVDELKNELQELVNLVIEEKRRLYIFIDDLDRLPPEKAVDLLEGIKNFIDIDRCVFIIAVDLDIVRQGLIKRYPGLLKNDKNDSKGENSYDSDKNIKIDSFMEKIINVPFTISDNKYSLKMYVEHLYFPDGRQSDNRFDEIKKFDDYLKVVEETGMTNPRVIKRLFNTCLFEFYIHDNEQDTAGYNIKLIRFIVKARELQSYEKFKNIIKLIKDKDSQLQETLSEYIGYELMEIALPEYGTNNTKRYEIFKEFINEEYILNNNHENQNENE